MTNQIEVGGSDTATPINVAKRVKLIAQWVDLPSTKLLDAGCGAGEYVEALCAAGANAQGIEYVETKVDQWAIQHPGDNRVQRGDLAKLLFEDHTFDAVLLNEVLEHVPDDKLALQEIFRVLKPSGKIILFSPSRFYPFETHGVYSLKTGKHFGVGKTFLLPWIPMAIGKRFFHYWSRNYWPVELRAMLRAAGFTIRNQSYVWQTFENNSGQQSNFARRLAPVLRSVSNVAERLPVLRRLGVSQLIVAERVQ